MRKKLDSRFPAARIKKIMQVDEEVGKIALSTPLLVSKALELFLQDLLGRTYSIMRERGGKTLNSGYLKQCLEQHREYDFLKELAASITDTAPETPRPGVEGPGSTSMGRGRRKKAEADEVETDDSGENSTRHGKVRAPDSPIQESARTLRGMKRQTSTSSTRSSDATEFQVVECKRPRYEANSISESKSLEAQGNGVKEFDLNFDLNVPPEIEEPAAVTRSESLEAPGSVANEGSAGCNSDEDYDAE